MDDQKNQCAYPFAPLPRNDNSVLVIVQLVPAFMAVAYSI